MLVVSVLGWLLCTVLYEALGLLSFSWIYVTRFSGQIDRYTAIGGMTMRAGDGCRSVDLCRWRSRAMKSVEPFADLRRRPYWRKEAEESEHGRMLAFGLISR
jgi:hypothetical protein